MRARGGVCARSGVERLLVRLGAALVLAACDDAGVAPVGGAPPRQGPSIVPVTLRLSPDTSTMLPGATLQVEVVLLDSRGAPVVPSAPFTYDSDAPAVATVSSTGVVTAVTPGSALISASAPVAGWSRGASMLIVVPGRDGDEVRLTLHTGRGWQPSVVHVPVGGTVRWSTRRSGNANPTLWLFGEGPGLVDSLDLRSGTATRRFDVAGRFTYCSGGCFDRGDVGVIDVR